MKKRYIAIAALLLAGATLCAQAAAGAAPAAAGQAAPATAASGAQDGQDAAQSGGGTPSLNDVALQYVDYLFKDGSTRDANHRKLSELSAYLTPEQQEALCLRRIERLLDDDVEDEDTRQKIYELSAQLAPEQRESLYEEHDEFGLTPFLLNMLVGFGVGSFVQGDGKAGVWQLIGSIVGDGLMAGGIWMTFFNDADGATEAGLVMTAASSLILTGVTVLAAVRPWLYAKRHNEQLRNALRVDEAPKAEVSLLPLVEPVGARYGVALRVQW